MEQDLNPQPRHLFCMVCVNPEFEKFSLKIHSTYVSSFETF